MDDLKLFGESEDQIDSLVQITVQLFSEDIGTKFGLKKCIVNEKRKKGEI